MRVLIGLGNPGAQYEKSRHNLGFVALDAVAAHYGIKNWKSAHGGDLAEVSQGGEKALLFKPQKFMNLSGLPVRALLDYYKLAPKDLCIIADDVYVAPGSARIRRSGGDGGHNGWKSVLQQVDPDTFWRVRIGAGLYPQGDKEVHYPALDQYVLESLPKHERKQAELLIDKLVPKLVEWLEHGVLEEATLHT
jgi:peptidyl-tRNA hydrolase, PTH1 family